MMFSFSRRKNTSEDLRLTKRSKRSKNLYLFFSEIMRKLKRSFKKEKPQQQQQQHDKRLFMKTKEKKRLHKSLSTKDHFFLERMTSRSHQEHYYDNKEKHMFEMLLLNNRDFDQNNQRRIVSLLPEYSSPFSSPGRIWDQNSSTAFSRSVASHDFMESETIADDSITIKVIEKNASSSQGSNNPIINEISEVEAYDEEKESEILKEAFYLLSVTSSSEEYKSILDPIFIEYEIIPTKGESKIQPLYPMDAKESIFKYIKDVLEAIDSNLEDLYLKTDFSDQLLNPALINNIPFYPNQFFLDHELVFDFINEVLLELCMFVPQWIKPTTQVFSSFSIESIVHKVSKEVYFRLLPLRSTQSLDEIVMEDIDKSANWLEVRCELECIGFETSDLILDELLEELMFDL